MKPLGNKPGIPYIRFHNREFENKINEVRMEMGYTIKKLAEKCGCSPSSILSLCQGTTGPLDPRKGQLKKWVVKLCKTLKAKPAYLFPSDICDIARTELLPVQIIDIVHGYNKEDKQHFSKDLRDALATLTEREQKIMKKRYLEGYTLEKIAGEEGVTRERINQIKFKALRKLRCLPVCRKLKNKRR